MSDSEPEPKAYNGGMGFWAMTGEALLGMLKQVEAGDSAEMVYFEHFVNSTITED